MGKRPASSRKDQMATTPKAPHQPPESEGRENTIPPMVNTNSKLRMQGKSAKSSQSRKGAKQYNAIVRRSSRIRNSVTPVQNRDIDITISDSEMEDDQPLLEEELNESDSGEELSEPNSVEELSEPKSVEELSEPNSRAKKRSPIFSEGPEMGYKNLYIKSQKKVEALATENRELSLKLEFALGKLEGYEKGTFAYSEVMEKMKDLIMVSALAKATERVVNPSSQAVGAVAPPDTVQDPKPASKRKRQS